ncbi:hypothetical protein BwiPL1_54360 (plasmid) [Bacillus wiedmannii]|nr:hypothetical protein BwiPL1_54360 [Bacillus wiedmannii]
MTQCLQTLPSKWFTFHKITSAQQLLAIIFTKNEEYSETWGIKGLGLVDFSVEVHYEETIYEEILNIKVI